MHNIILISLFLFSFVCSTGDNKTVVTDPKKDNKPGNTDTKQTNFDLKPNQTIIPAAEKMEWAFGRNYKQYSPSMEDIQTAEEVLKACFTKEASGTANPFFGRKYEDYNMQFVGGELEGGDKIIWVNCFCMAESEILKKWKTEIVMVADGGNCFFNVKINLKNKEYYGLMVNGMA
ncbi:MAG TPA: hypothetical protein PKE39_05900 [Ignavibacteria bacterium]|nr:hypothetical protein [Ignavibacteria bacterium]HMQ98538.1 hypothetical protein [Ignavibacteria bacterium]